MSYKVRLIVVMLALATVDAESAHATDDTVKVTARGLAEDANRDFLAGDYEQAYQKFQRAYDLAKVPRLALWTARTLVKRGKLVRASELYREATTLASNDLWLGDSQQQAQVEARQELDDVLPRIPTLNIGFEGAPADDVEVTIDGVRLVPTPLGMAIPCDPGLRHVVGKRQTESVEQTITLVEGMREMVVLRFKGIASPATATASGVPPQPLATETSAGATAPALTPEASLAATPAETSTPRTSPRRTWGFVALGVGAAGLLTGIGTGIALMASDLRDQCHNDTCNPTKTDGSSVSDYNTLRNISTVGFIAGGIGTAAGLTLLLWPTKLTTADEPAPRAAIWLGPSSAGLKGRF